MSKTVICVENLSKQYRLGQVGTGTLSHDLNRWWHQIRGKEDPYLKIGETNDRASKAESEYVWALKDINFEVQQGEVLGIIGKNGAGKSTLLKILSKVTGPTTGSIKAKGRIAALLEVGTGFHPELTGRENIFLNGTLLGMTRREVSAKLDEIVDFAGVARYLDTPVKRYSSGMMVRLGFAVAAHLEPEILIVDEVLAVGDAEFQKKAVGKMQEVSKEGGRTVLFVSHNMVAVRSLCNKGFFLENGEMSFSGSIEDTVSKYLQHSKFQSNVKISKFNEGFELISVEVKDNGISGNFNIEEELDINIKTRNYENFDLININVFFNAGEGGLIFATCSQAESMETGEYIFTCKIPANTLNDNIYSLDIMAVENGEKILIHAVDAINIQGVESNKRNGSWMGKFPGLLRPTNYVWLRSKIKN